MRAGDEEELTHAFKETIRLETELENAKIKLARESDFNLMDGFQMIDRGGRGWVTSLELIDSLRDIGMYADRDSVYLFTRRYDRDSDGRLLYSDFCEAFTPKDSYYSTSLTSRSAYYIHRGVDKKDFFTRITRD